jgi:CHASE2 domain-containing sensor protein
MNVSARRRSRAVAVLLAGIFAAGVAGAADLGRLLPGLEQESIVQRFERRGAEPAPKLLVVAVDDKTFADTQLH